MISKTVLNVSSNSTVSLDRVKPKGTESKDGDEKKDIKDTIDLGVGLDVAEKLKNASSTDDLASLLKEGQEESKKSIAKFQALLEERGGGAANNATLDYGNVLFEAVRKTIVGILSEQSSETKSYEFSKSSFEAQVTLYIRESDPNFKPTSSKEEEAE